MKNKYIVFVIFVLIIAALLFILYKLDYRYKVLVGIYDSYALHKLEDELGDFLYVYDNNQLTKELMREIEGDLEDLNSYIFRSPKLNFMNLYIDDIASYDVEDINRERIDYCKELYNELKRIRHVINDKKGNSAINTYEYFDKKANENLLKKYLKIVR